MIVYIFTLISLNGHTITKFSIQKLIQFLILCTIIINISMTSLKYFNVYIYTNFVVDPK